MQRSDVAGDAVDGKPGAGLPDPVSGGVGGQGVIEAEGAADAEGSVRDVVDLAGRPFLLAVIDEEGTDFEGGGLVSFGVGGCVGLGIGHAAEWAEGDCVDLGGGGYQRTRGKKCGERQEKKFCKEAVECGAERARSQTQEKGLAGENSVAVMLLDALCSLRDKFGDGLTLSGWKKRAGERNKVQYDPKDVQRY